MQVLVTSCWSCSWNIPYLADERRLKLKYFLSSLFRSSAHKACVLLSSRSVFYEQIFIELHYIPVRVKDMFKRPLEWPFTKQVCWVLCHCSVGEGWGRMGRLLCLHWLHDTAHFARTRIHLRLIGLREFLWTNTQWQMRFRGLPTIVWSCSCHDFSSHLIAKFQWFEIILFYKLQIFYHHLFKMSQSSRTFCNIQIFCQKFDLVVQVRGV